MAVLSHFLSTSKHCVKALTLLSVFFQHQSATHLSTESFQNWSQRKRFQMFHLSLQTGLGRPYSVARHMFFRPSQNYVQLSCHHCSRRDQSQMSERRPKVLSHHIHCKMAIQIELHWLDATKVIGPCWNAEATHVEILGGAVEPWARASIGWNQARFVVVPSDWQPTDP